MTDQLKHTPGPWRAGIGEDAMPTRNEFEQEIACLPHMYLDAIDIFAPKRDDASPHDCCTEEFEANARLIAAAPDLYEALQQICFADRDELNDACSEIWARANDVLNKVSPATPLDKQEVENEKA